MPEFVCRALLLDIDGTLLDSLPAVDRAWTGWALRQGMDPAEVLPHIHGRRSLDSIRFLRPDLDAEAENLWIRHAEATDTAGVRPLPGAIELLKSLPVGTFAVVTSGTSDVANARLAAVGFDRPAVSIYGEDVARGKPCPDPYLMAAARLGVAPNKCVVFEDAAAGVLSGKAAGMRVVGISTAGRPEELIEADVIVPDLTRVRVKTEEPNLRLLISS